jgi:hypothetical protein
LYWTIPFLLKLSEFEFYSLGLSWWFQLHWSPILGEPPETYASTDVSSSPFSIAKGLKGLQLFQLVALPSQRTFSKLSKDDWSQPSYRPFSSLDDFVLPTVSVELHKVDSADSFS